MFLQESSVVDIRLGSKYTSVNRDFLQLNWCKTLQSIEMGTGGVK